MDEESRNEEDLEHRLLEKFKEEEKGWARDALLAGACVNALAAAVSAYFGFGSANLFLGIAAVLLWLALGSWGASFL